MTLLEQNPSIMPIIWRRYSVFQTHEAAAKAAAVDELLCLKNAGSQVSMFFTRNEWSESRKNKRIIVLGDVLDLPANQNSKFNLISVIEGQIGYTD